MTWMARIDAKGKRIPHAQATSVLTSRSKRVTPSRELFRLVNAMSADDWQARHAWINAVGTHREMVL